MFTLLKGKQYQVTFLCEKNESTILHKNHQSIPNKPWQKIFCGLCSLNKRNGIAFMSWLHSFMTKTKVSCYKCWHCKRKTKVSSYVPLREKQVSFYITQLEEQKKQSIPNNSWQKIFCGLCSLNKRNGIAFMWWLHSFMTKTKVSCYKCWHCKRKTKVSRYVPLREKQVSFYITQLEEQNHQSIPNNSWQKIFCGLCSLNKRNGIAFMSWLHSFMTKTKVSCYKCWHCKRKTKVSSYVPLREKQKYHFTSLNWKSETTNLSLITPDKRYFAVSVLWISENS